jgi:hypothetical protein
MRYYASRQGTRAAEYFRNAFFVFFATQRAAAAAAAPPVAVLPTRQTTALSAALLTPSPSPITVPHLTGIFVSLDNVTASRSRAGWVADLTAMKQVGIEWFCVRAVAAGTASPAPSAACPLGGFHLYFPPGREQQGACFSAQDVDTVGTILDAAKQVGLGVHLGLGYPHTSKFPAGMNATEYYRSLAIVNWEVALQLWSLYGQRYGTILRGWYTDVEESNTRYELELMNNLVTHYLEPLARDIHNMTAHQATPTSVWASPYYVGNLTRHALQSIMTPRFYADWWEQIFDWSPHLDLIAPQDSMGAQGNSFANVTSFLTELAGASRRAHRQVFSNVELFEVWPQDCHWSGKSGECHGRHPAPFDRIRAQMANEAPLVDELIAWEWHSCLSPFGTSSWTSTLYSQYKAYVGR